MATVQLKRVRLAFPDIWRPGKVQTEGDTPKYGASLIFPKDSENYTLCFNALMEESEKLFGPNWKAVVKAMEKSKKCLRQGNDNLDKDGKVRDGFLDNFYLVARNRAKPAIVGARAKNADGSWNYLTEADGKPYGGCYVNAKVNIKAMKAKDKMPNQVYATLEALQFVCDGDSFGAGPGNPEGFDDEDDAGAEGGSDGSDGGDLF